MVLNPYPPGSEAYKKTEINWEMQARYDELIHIGKHGHYETMFKVFHEMLDKVRKLEGW
jgi:hypothetical protein